MKSKFESVQSKLMSVALVIVLLFSCACVVVSELQPNVALAEEQGNEQAAVSYNDLTSGSSEVFLPNYDSEVITKTNLKKPKVQTFGEHDASYYPSYTNQLSSDFDDDKKAKILAENIAMLADVQAWYEAGTLKQNLKKHASADGQFYNANGNYKKARRIEKVVTINSLATPRKRSLGVFAPAGEIITITIDESLVGKLTVNIGYPYSANDIGSGNFDRWSGDRMARFYVSFKLTDTVNYIGSPLGGMVTLDGGSGMGNYDIKISGGVDMPSYKLGVSTKEDWQNILAAPAPYVWLETPYQYFVMPKVEIADIEDPYNAMLWWHKASMVSIYSIAREDTSHFYTPVISTFDSFVFIGEAVATVWSFYTNCPRYWAHSVLDYDNLMYSGAWGALHEYNHHHQAHSYPFNFDTEWGVGDGNTEMTNNVLNAISYIALTDIALTRSESNIFNGWAAVSDPYCNYNKLKNATANTNDYGSLGNNKLFGFVDLMHTFGEEKFADFLRAIYGYGDAVEGYDGTNMSQDAALKNQNNFALFASLYYKTDFTDYFTNVWHFDLSSDTVSRIKSYNFDKYFSINNLYSAGAAGVETGRAYQVSPTETTVFDFNKYTLCSVDNYKLESVSNPQHGTLIKNSDGTYSYTPDKGFEQDSFNLVYKVTVGDSTYTRTLVVKLVNQASAEAERASGKKTYAAPVDFRNLYLNHWYSNSVNFTPVDIKCLDNDGNEVVTVSGADVNAMIDGNTGTGFHTAWQGTKTPYPHNYYFTFAETASFNRINFYFQNNGTRGYYSFGEYEIYTSDDGANYELLRSGKNTETNFSVTFDTIVSAKYVKIVVKSNAAGNAFTNITEVQFVQSLDLGLNYNVYSANGGLLHYNSNRKWNVATGSYLNTQAMSAKRGKVKFYVTGTDLMVYSTNSQSKITIDGTTYTIKANDSAYSPSFVIDGLSEGRHLVEIDGKNMALDMIKTSGTVTRDNSPFVNWPAMGVSIAAGVGFVATLTTWAVLTFKPKKETTE